MLYSRRSTRGRDIVQCYIPTWLLSVQRPLQATTTPKLHLRPTPTPDKYHPKRLFSITSTERSPYQRIHVQDPALLAGDDR